MDENEKIGDKDDVLLVIGVKVDKWSSEFVASAEIVTTSVNDILDVNDTLDDIEDDTHPEEEIEDEAVSEITALEVLLTREEREAAPTETVTVEVIELLIEVLLDADTEWDTILVALEI